MRQTLHCDKLVRKIFRHPSALIESDGWKLMMIALHSLMTKVMMVLRHETKNGVRLYTIYQHYLLELLIYKSDYPLVIPVCIKFRGMKY